MSDVKCPYCGNEQEINHDDGYGYEEDRDYEQQCDSCDADFHFTTSISYHYDVYCQEGGHDMEPLGYSQPGMIQCTKCDYYTTSIKQ
jgi:hypothetical protein